MGISLDIDLYKDGFDYQYVDCIQGPIAAAAGHFYHNNYFYYCFLHCVKSNFEDFSKRDILSYSNQFLGNMGLELVKINCSSYSSMETITRISNEILNGRPVILIVKYNALFYNVYYKNDTFTTNHGIIVNEYNEANNVFGIKESSLLRDSIDAYKNRDIYFSLHITSDMLNSILEYSNTQFINEKSAYVNSIYSLQQFNDIELDTNDILELSLQIFESGRNELLSIIETFKSNNDFSRNIRFYRLRFYGCLKPIFYLLDNHCKKNKVNNAFLENTEKTISDTRNKVLNILNRASLKEECLNNEQRLELCNRVLAGDEELVNLIKHLITYENKEVRSNFFVNLDKYYNNRAFEDGIYDDSSADITGEGTHFIMKNIISNKIWQKGEHSFMYSFCMGKNDNITCVGQVIEIPEVYSKELCILGCSEFGSYNEEIEIEYLEEVKQKIIADFSDFYQPPLYQEKVFWMGVAADRKNGKTRIHNFNARLFAKKYSIKPGKVIRLILPNKKNVHIFAVTLNNF